MGRLKMIEDTDIGVWIDAMNGSKYRDVDSSRLLVRFEDGTCMMYNQDEWPILTVTHVLILPTI